MKAEAAVRSHRVTTYWNVGRHLDGYFKTQKDPSGTDLKRIAKDLDYSVDALRKMLKLYQTFPRLPKVVKLSWTRYRALLTAPADQRRSFVRRAYQYVVERLKSVKFIIVKTRKSGKYGRYLADIYYLPGENDPQKVAQKGIFLNQELLDKGLAWPYRP